MFDDILGPKIEKIYNNENVKKKKIKIDMDKPDKPEPLEPVDPDIWNNDDDLDEDTCKCNKHDCDSCDDGKHDCDSCDDHGNLSGLEDDDVE